VSGRAPPGSATVTDPCGSNVESLVKRPVRQPREQGRSRIYVANLASSDGAAPQPDPTDKDTVIEMSSLTPGRRGEPYTYRHRPTVPETRGGVAELGAGGLLAAKTTPNART